MLGPGDVHIGKRRTSLKLQLCSNAIKTNERVVAELMAITTMCLDFSETAPEKSYVIGGHRYGLSLGTGAIDA